MTDENTKAHSPVPVEGGVETAAGLSFFDALKSVVDGKRITKKEWANEKVVGYLENGQLLITLADGSKHQWVISDGDLNGVDWVVL